MPISLERVEVYYKHKQEYLDLKKQHPGKLRELPPLEPKTEAERAQQNTVTMPVHPKEEETEGSELSSSRASPIRFEIEEVHWRNGEELLEMCEADVVGCRPHRQGGQGVRRLECVNTQDTLGGACGEPRTRQS